MLAAGHSGDLESQSARPSIQVPLRVYLTPVELLTAQYLLSYFFFVFILEVTVSFSRL